MEITTNSNICYLVSINLFRFTYSNLIHQFTKDYSGQFFNPCVIPNQLYPIISTFWIYLFLWFVALCRRFSFAHLFGYAKIVIVYSKGYQWQWVHFNFYVTKVCFVEKWLFIQIDSKRFTNGLIKNSIAHIKMDV